MSILGDIQVIEEWRKQGFYYDFDDRLGIRQWRLYGSKKGLNNFVEILKNYILDEKNAEIGEHEHYEPYYNLQITTTTTPRLTDQFIDGSIEDLSNLKKNLENKIINTEVGATFDIDRDYGVENTVTVKFFVMCDSFDPSTLDRLVVSKR